MDDRKYPLVSAYIYNFTQFTTWPAGAVKGVFNVCVVGRDPFGASLEPMTSRKVNDQKIAIRRFSQPEAAMTACNVLFVASSESDNLRGVLAVLKGAPVLTMSDIEGFADQGGMVEFRPADGKIGIWIGLAAVRTAGITISSKLLSLAHIRG